ncbi:MAG TPA: sce7725 family protein, partial [Draconibacterium sp.]|nr:sce7725 family protein [Draconibacterium sp.]
MYFPYLRGRQFELIALREFAIEREDNNNVFPIIEPVKKTFNSFKLAIPKFIEGTIPFAIILNPQVGDLVGHEGIYEELEDELEDCSWTPAFIVKDNLKEIKAVIKKYQFDDVMLICSKIVDTSSDKFLDLATGNNVEYIVTEENKSLKRKLKGSGKNLVLLSDCFIPKKRNSDYLNALAEKFTEENIFFDDDGYFGFSDYTTVSSEFNEGGTTPYAVSIHLT